MLQGCGGGESLLVGLYQYQLYKVGHCRVGRWGRRAPVGHCCLWFLGVSLVLVLVFFDNLGVGSEFLGCALFVGGWAWPDPKTPIPLYGSL